MRPDFGAALAATLLLVLTPTLAGPPNETKPLAERYPDGWCGTSEDTLKIVQEKHRRNVELLGEAPKGGFNDRIQDNIVVLDDDGRLVVAGETDIIAIVNRAIDLVGDNYDVITVFTASTR